MMELDKNKKTTIVVVAIFVGLLLAAYLLFKPYSSAANYFPYINGSVFFISGVYLFLLSFRIYRPKHKTVEQALKVDNMLKSLGNRGKFGSVFMILFGAYNLIWHDPDFYRLHSTIENNKWTANDKAVMIKNCMKGAVNATKKYPQITLDYCTCSIDKIMKSVNRKEYIDKISKSPEQEYKIDSPLIQGCLVVYIRAVDSVKKQAK